MSEAEPTGIHHYRDGEVVLYKRERSSRWQARFKLQKEWHRISTLSKNLKEAAAYACEKFDEAKYRAKFDLPQVTRRFSRVAKLAIKAMEAELEVGMGKSVYQTYIAVIKLHLIPFFGKHNIDSIKPDEYNKFYDQQEIKQGKKLSRSTITNYNSALNRIFDLALANQWITKSQVPALKNKGQNSDRRPAFSYEEYMLMVRRLREWAKGGAKEVSGMVRRLLRDYVLILANTGMRPGTESDNLKWKHIHWHSTKNGERYLRIHVNGKTGGRELIARHRCEIYLKRIQSRFADLKKMTFDDLLKANVDEYVFRLENEKRTKLNKNFEIFLGANDLLKDPLTEQNRTLYSLRHTYATLSLTRENFSIYDLAMQMGTSVQMIEQHYSHLTPAMKAKMLAGERYEK